jgi:hypothetical protein
MTSTEDYWRSEYYRERNEKLRLLTTIENLRQHLEDVHGCRCERTPSIATKERESSSSSDTDDTT